MPHTTVMGTSTRQKDSASATEQRVGRHRSGTGVQQKVGDTGAGWACQQCERAANAVPMDWAPHMRWAGRSGRSGASGTPCKVMGGMVWAK